MTGATRWENAGTRSVPRAGPQTGSHPDCPRPEFLRVAPDPVALHLLPVPTQDQATAFLTLTDGSESDVTALVAWTSDSALLATVTVAGIVLPVAVGTTAVRATYLGLTDSSPVVVTAT